MEKVNNIRKSLLIIAIICLNKLVYSFSEGIKNHKYSVRIIQKRLNKNDISKLYNENGINNNKNLFRKLNTSSNNNGSKIVKNGIYSFLSNSSIIENDDVKNKMIISENTTILGDSNLTNKSLSISNFNDSLNLENKIYIEDFNGTNLTEDFINIFSNKNKISNKKNDKINKNSTPVKKGINSNIRGADSKEKNMINSNLTNEIYNKEDKKIENNSLNNSVLIEKKDDFNLNNNLNKDLAQNKSDFNHIFNVIQDPEWITSNGDYYIIEFTEYNSSVPIVRLINLSVGLYNKNVDANIAKQLISSIFGTRDLNDPEDEDDEFNSNFGSGLFNINDIINWDDFDFIDEMPSLFRKLNNIIWF